MRIGLEAPLTGDQKSIGIGMLDGAKLAASEMNARGGLLGRKVEIVPIDDAADPATGKTAATAAIAEGLDGVVGPYNSGVGAETLPLYLAAGMVPIRLTSADATAGLGFTLQPMTSQIAPVAADALTDVGTGEVGRDHLRPDRALHAVGVEPAEDAARAGRGRRSPRTSRSTRVRRATTTS